MTQHMTTDLFTLKSYQKAMIPALISAFGLALADMADALVLGHSMQATGLAAVNLAVPVFMVINLVMHSLGAGGAIRFSKFLGSGDPEKASQSFSQVAQATFAIGVLLTIVGNMALPLLMPMLGVNQADGELYTASSMYVRLIICGIPIFFTSYVLNYYLRNDDNQKLASKGFTYGNLSDLALNFILVLFLDMGVLGAALATILGQVIAILFYLPGMMGKSHLLHYKPVKPDLREPVRCFSLGFSTTIQYIYQAIFFLIVNNALMHGIGENGVAIFTVLQNMSYLVLYLYDGSAKAAQPLISTYIGERNDTGRKTVIRLAMIVGNVLGGLLCGLLGFFASTVCRVFGLESAELLTLGTSALRIYCLSLVFAGSGCLMESYYQACEQERRALLLATLRGAVVLLPCTFIFALLDIYLFWWLFLIVELLSLGIFVLLAPKLAPIHESHDKVFSHTIPCISKDISDLTQKIQDFCADNNATPKQEYFVGMAFEEVCMAILQNAFGDRTDGIIQVTVVAADDSMFELHIRDNAIKYDPFSQADEDNLDYMGIEVIRKKAKSFFYRHYQGFNTLTLKI